MQWLSLPETTLCLNNDREILTFFSLEECKASCMTWSNGPCKSCSFRRSSPDHRFYPWCCLSSADQHSNREDMIYTTGAHIEEGDYAENCEGKNTLSQSFDQENNYVKSGKSLLNVREFSLSEFVKMDSAGNYQSL